MSSLDPQQIAELKALVAQGHKLDAIKLYRAATGAGLAKAKEAVESLERGDSLPEGQSADPGMDLEIVSLVGQGRTIEAVKLYRQATGAGLKEAKDAVDAIAQRHNLTATKGSGCLGVVLLAVLVSSALPGLLGRIFQ